MKFSLAAAVVGGTTLLRFGVTALPAPAPALDASSNPGKAIENRDIPIWTKFKEKHYSPFVEFRGDWDPRRKQEIERAFEWWKRDDNEAPAIAKREASIPNPDSYRPAGVIDVDGEKYTLASDEKKNGRGSYTKEAKPWDDPAFWRKTSWGKRAGAVSDGECFEKRGFWNFTKSLIGGCSDSDSSVEKILTQIGLPMAEKEILPRKAPPTENSGKGSIAEYGGSRQGSFGSFGSFGSGGGSFSSGGGSFSRGGSREGSFGSFGSEGGEGEDFEEYEKRDGSIAARKAPAPPSKSSYDSYGSVGGGGSFSSGGGSFSGSGSREGSFGSFGSFGSEGGEGEEEEEEYDEYEKRGLKQNKTPSSSSSVSSLSSELSQPSWDDYEQPFEFYDDEKRSIWDHDFQNVLDDLIGAFKNATAFRSALGKTAMLKQAEAKSSD
jgi:hypothetical protein